MTHISKSVEFIQAILVNINGQARGKIYPVEKYGDLLNGHDEVICILPCVGPAYEIPTSVPWISDNHYDNLRMEFDTDSFKIAPWVKDKSLAFMFFDVYFTQSNEPFPFNVRMLAKNKVDELTSRGYHIMIGVENEFQLFKKNGKERIENESRLMNQMFLCTNLMDFLAELKHQLKMLHIEMDSVNMEYGKGQIEIPTKPYFDMDGIDKMWLLKEVVRYAANSVDKVATFMTLPMPKDVANGMHLNHSLWRKTSDGLVNVMHSDMENQLSEVGQNWLAGVMKHSRALCAFFSPTVNCYRRISMAAWAPNIISWKLNDRFVAFRVKTSKERTSRNFIENRLPTACCNIYLAVAGMIVAGLDGIDKKMKLIEPGNGNHCEKLPTSLKEALEALRNDDVLVNGLGETFVDWYIKCKMEMEVNVLKDVDLNDFSEEGMAKEFQEYFHI